VKYLLIIFFLTGCHWTESAPPKYNWCYKNDYVEGTMFALFPKNCPNHIVRWMETVKVKYCYDVPTPFSGVERYDTCLE